MFDARPIIAAGEWVLRKQRESDARRNARHLAEFEQALRGAIVGAPADPEAFG